MNTNRPFAAAPAASPGTAFRDPDGIPSEGIRRIPANAYEPDPWIELAWNLNQGWAWLTLYVTPGDLPIQQWDQKFSIPDMPYADGAAVIRGLTHLANLLHAMYVANPDIATFTPQLAKTVLNFHDFLTR